METRVMHSQMTFRQRKTHSQMASRQRNEKDRASEFLENQNENAAMDFRNTTAMSTTPKKAGGANQTRAKKRKAESFSSSDAESDSNTLLEFILNKPDRPLKKQKASQTPKKQKSHQIPMDIAEVASPNQIKNRKPFRTLQNISGWAAPRRHSKKQRSKQRCRRPKGNPWIEDPNIPRSPIRIYYGPNAGDIKKADRERRQNRRLQGYYDYEGEPGEKIYFHEGYGWTNEAGRKTKERLRKFYIDYPEQKRKQDVCGLYGIVDSEWEGSDEGNHLSSTEVEGDHRLVVEDDGEEKENENEGSESMDWEKDKED